MIMLAVLFWLFAALLIGGFKGLIFLLVLFIAGSALHARVKYGPRSKGFQGFHHR